ncbi:FMRFamide receptor-like [Mya arenaria]|uniref:FMRFamide receptor-like n=1 Tax=Mya arenaria TaxID=6604 RepID=UPI0022DEAA55|nr:FMRFamide receptor-like [Mya arenaria]
MTPEILATVLFCMDGVASAIVIVFGLAGNAMALFILTRPKLRSSTYTFLTGLALWDMAVLLGTLFFISLPQLSDDYKRHVWPFVMVYVYPAVLVVRFGTIWTTVSLTVERYIAVCIPLKVTTLCTVHRARIILVIVAVAAVLFNVCRWFEYAITETVEIHDNHTIALLGYTETAFGHNAMFKRIYYQYIYTIVVICIPFGLLAVINTHLMLAVRRSKLAQETMCSRKYKEHRVSVMLTVVVLVFICCQVPAVVYNIAYSINVDIKDAFHWQVLSSLRNLLITVNSAVNFLLYYALSKKFRSIFMQVFCRKRIQK